MRSILVEAIETHQLRIPVSVCHPRTHTPYSVCNILRNNSDYTEPLRDLLFSLLGEVTRRAANALPKQVYLAERAETAMVWTIWSLPTLSTVLPCGYIPRGLADCATHLRYSDNCKKIELQYEVQGNSPSRKLAQMKYLHRSVICKQIDIPEGCLG